MNGSFKIRLRLKLDYDFNWEQSLFRLIKFYLVEDFNHWYFSLEKISIKFLHHLFIENIYLDIK